MQRLIQGSNVELIQTKKTVEWLINHTTVSVFDPITFEGYQRKIDEKHCAKIVKYLEHDFVLPTSIICARDAFSNVEASLRIVDGQHRIKAFELLRDRNLVRYDQIKDYEVSVIIMVGADEAYEIDTFITINKTSKRVDTSLAYVLKNKLNISRNSDDLSISKLDYISVELAQRVSEGAGNDLWKNRISYTGAPKNDIEFISLNAFVRATRRVVGHLSRKKIVDISWETEESVSMCLNDIELIFNAIWESVYLKWPGLFNTDFESRKIIQGSIGYSSICKFIAAKIKGLDEEEINNISEQNRPIFIRNKIKNWIESINIDEQLWMPGNRFAKSTSESGFSVIAQELERSMN